ncbi:fatty acid desaturase [Aureivirga marina]|uniref:fatty acid desaturase n=1 Tax=Aureivirga marina TaxID=1182451 RepID=UPI0018CB2DB8|nr:fatty acid desaturase [Aureivirga marina]
MTHQEIIKKIEWKDLKKLNTKELLIENNITIPWFLFSMFLAFYEHYLLAIPFSAYFFLTSLRQVHNGLHNSLGTSKFLTWFTLFSNSILIITSNHAFKFNHLRHHKYCLSEEDQEGKSAHMTWYQAIFYGPIHLIKIHTITWKLANKKYKKNMLLELFAIGLFIFSAFYFQLIWLQYHILMMVLGEFLMSFFAVWLVHHDTSEKPEFARTQRN